MRETLSSPAEPKLAPPGAGVPSLELLWLRPGFWMLQRLWSDDRAARVFEKEADRILPLVDGLTPEQGARRVLIKRLPGIEDSSRFWSAFMVLEHLRIVNDGMARIIETLSRGHRVPGEVSTAAVKPAAGIGLEAVKRFQNGVGDFTDRTRAVLPSASRVRHAHPWFGPLDAHGWHCLAAMHQGIHRRQLEAILLRLELTF
jgi:hypothetical protein